MPNDEFPPTDNITDIEADIEQTREELGHTVDALRDKLDVKSRAQHKAGDVKDKAAHFASEAKEKPAIPAGAVAAAVLAVVAVWLWRRR